MFFKFMYPFSVPGNYQRTSVGLKCAFTCFMRPFGARLDPLGQGLKRPGFFNVFSFRPFRLCLFRAQVRILVVRVRRVFFLRSCLLVLASISALGFRFWFVVFGFLGLGLGLGVHGSGAVTIYCRTEFKGAGSRPVRFASKSRLA